MMFKDRCQRSRGGRAFLSVAALGMLILASGACRVSEDEGAEDTEPVKESNAAIVGGALDSTHAATVALQAVWFEDLGYAFRIRWSDCSGSIVRVDPSTGTGTLITAAHCFQGRSLQEISIYQGSDYNYKAPGRVLYTPTSLIRFPNETYDIAVMTFSGATAQTPAVPLRPVATPPAAGDPATLVGYGKTPGDNTKRRSVGVNLESLDSSGRIISYSPSGTSCFGDSGGPLLTQAGGQEWLTGVISEGNDATCTLGPSKTWSTWLGSEPVANWLASLGISMGPEPSGWQCAADAECASGYCGGGTCGTRPPPGSCALPWGGTIPSGSSVTAYQSAYTGYQSDNKYVSRCTSESRTCTNGTLSGSYTNNACDNYPCTYNGAEFAGGTLAYPSSTYGSQSNVAACITGRFRSATATGPAAGACQWGSYWAEPGTCGQYQGKVYRCGSGTWTVQTTDAKCALN